MLRSKLAHPLAACNVCGARTNLLEAVNHRCDRVVTGRRCYGTYKSGIIDLWDACESCGATGWVGTVPCTACAGFGWSKYG